MIAPTSISCPVCGASVDINPEDVIVVCPYCGSAFTRGKETVKDQKIVPPKYSKEEAEKKIFDWIYEKTKFRGTKRVQAIKVEKILVPFWVMFSHVRTHYVGYRRTTRSESYSVSMGGKTQTRTKTVTVYEPVDREIIENRSDPLICRMGATIFGYKEINDAVIKAVNMQIYEDFDLNKLKDNPQDIKFLSGEIKRNDARELIETKIQDEHRQRARNDTTELFDCRTFIEVKGIGFLHYPIVYVEYLHGRETYRVVMDGYSGEIIAAELPITTRYRVLMEALALSSIFAVMVLGAFFYPTLLNNEYGLGGIIYLVTSAVIIFLGILANNIAWSTETRTKEKKKKLLPFVSPIRTNQQPPVRKPGMKRR